MGVEAGKGGQQGGVDVEQAVVPTVDEAGGQDAHEAGEADEVDRRASSAAVSACLESGAVGDAVRDGRGRRCRRAGAVRP